MDDKITLISNYNIQCGEIYKVQIYIHRYVNETRLNIQFYREQNNISRV